MTNGLSCYRCGSWDGTSCDCPDGQTLFFGEARDVLRHLELSVDLVFTDPPYSSGGSMRSDRNQQTSAKYRLSDTFKTNPEFSGDNRDQRAFTIWCSDWMASALSLTRSGGAILCAIDWRNLPCVIDAVQVGGWVYRALIPWDKTEQCRPNKGWFRAQCEYFVAASAGRLAQGKHADGICSPGFIETNRETFEPGFVRARVIGKQKRHITEKPVPLVEMLLMTRNDWQTVIDPFVGSGTLLEACRNLGRRGIGIELSEEYCEIICNRLKSKSLL